MDSISDFWESPPWQVGDRKFGKKNGQNKHRLGLKPIALSELWARDDALSENKAQQLKSRYSEVVATHPGYETYQWQLPGITYVPREYPDWVACLGAQVAEDICILDAQDDNRLVAGCLAAPSYWSLKAKLGQPLHDVHEPVEGMNKKIGGRIVEFFARLPVDRPFRRENWFVHGEAEYFRQNPGLRTQLSENPDHWMFRSERQTLLRLDERFVVFVIGIVFARFTDIRMHRDALDTFKTSLAAMDDDEVMHFGGLAKMEQIANYVDSI